MTKLQTITSGAKHSIRSVASVDTDRYITCDDDERSVISQGYRNGYGRRWWIEQIDADNWTIKSTRYDVYLSINDNGKVRASSHKDKWRIETTGTYGEFRIYNQERYGGRRLLSLADDTNGVPVSLKKHDGGNDELWQIEKF